MSDRVYSVARVYADVLSEKPNDYWDYEHCTHQSFPWGDISNYEIVSKIGRGKYSEVFTGICLLNNQNCVVKVLKPVKLKKIFREIKILQNLNNGINIVNLYDILQDKDSQIPALIFEKVNNIDFRILYPKFSINDIKFYFKQLLLALNYAHSMGIIHRDVKPQNIMIDPINKKLKLIDWGLAEFYHPGTNFNVRVASRYHKGPELLINLQQYDYSLDLWSVGAMLAAIIYRKEPFFKGDSNQDQLIKIAQVLGTQELKNYVSKYGLKLPSEFDPILGDYKRRPWSSFNNQDNKNYSNNKLAVDLIDNLLIYDHQLRLTAMEAINHPFFE
ncbi:casein kinase 2 catalytic subunit [Pichia kluyveri]|uniref:Casein kinase II subunit alpha n=1 Tax=Pichia kluyveri TaxID=36015 RepID=A0AAV5R8Y8_PICKL|nr:casein kinase 2 catalytic subunit [Pichia kluyveri]